MWYVVIDFVVMLSTSYKLALAGDFVVMLSTSYKLALAGFFDIMSFYLQRYQYVVFESSAFTFFNQLILLLHTIRN